MPKKEGPEPKPRRYEKEKKFMLKRYSLCLTITIQGSCEKSVLKTGKNCEEILKEI